MIQKMAWETGLSFFVDRKDILTYTPWGYIIMVSIISERSKMEEKTCNCKPRIKERSEKEYKDLLNRLNRVEGQVRGIKRMVEENIYCPDILIQVSAVKAALDSFNSELLSNHIRTCVTEDIKNGDESSIDELVATVKKIMK